MIFYFFLASFLSNAGFAASSPNFTELHDLEYDQVGGQSLKLDLFLPNASSSTTNARPAVVLVHGGCFNAGDKSENTSEAQDLASRGIVAAAINYRLAPQYLYPAAVTDAQQAVRFLRKNAAKYHIDPDRIASFGQSAGAYLALRLGVDKMPDRAGQLDAYSSRVRVVGDHYGRTDFTLSQGSSGTDCAVIFLGTTREQNPDLFKSASILTHVDGNSAPTFIAQGTADPQVNPIHSHELHQALDHAGVPNQLLLIPGAGHGFTGNDFAEAWNATLQFFSQYQ